MKTRIDGVEYEVSEQAAQAIEKERASAKAKLEESGKAGAEQKARADKAEATLEETKKALEVERKFRADQELEALKAKARECCGEAVKFDGLDAQGVQVAVLAHLSPEFKPEGKDAVYIQARFDAALERYAAGQRATGEVRIDKAAGKAPRTSEQAREEMIARNRGERKE